MQTETERSIKETIMYLESCKKHVERDVFARFSKDYVTDIIDHALSVLSRAEKEIKRMESRK